MPGAPAESPLVEIGRIVAPHGIRGQVKVHVPEPSSSVLLQAKKVYISTGGGPVERTVSRASPSSGTVIMKFDGADDRDAAEALRGAAVFVREDAMPRLPDGEYYLYELQGMAVEDIGGRGHGRVTGLSSNNAQDLLVVTGVDGREHLVPFTRGLIERVDRARRVVVVAAIGGLFE